MAAAVTFFHDYVDPVSFLVERRIAAAEETAGAVVERVPLEVRPPPGPLLDARSPAWRRRWEEAAEEARGEGLELVRPAILPWTRKAHELAFHAAEEGRFRDVHRALYRAAHLDGLDLGRVDVLTRVAVQAGLDRTRTRAVLDVDKHAAAVVRAREDAERRGVAGVPTLLAGNRALTGLPAGAEIRAFLAER